VVVAARNAQELAMLELKRLINVPLDQELQLDTGLDSGALPVVVEAAFAPPTRGALEAAESTIRLQEQAVRVQAAQDWPSLSVSTTLSHQAFPGEQIPTGQDFHRNWSAEVKLDVPIFSGFRNHGAADRERALLMQATAQRDRLREETALEVARARAELTRSQALLSSQRETVRQAQRAFELSEVRYANGLSTQIEVSDTRLQMQTAEVDQVRAVRDYLVAIADLERALGRTVKTETRPIDQISLLSP
jgi:outer membrane protein TolC